MSKKKWKETKIGKLVNGLFREGLQTLPVVGTVVSVFKKDTNTSPKGKITGFELPEIYRILIGIGVGYVLVKGLLTINEIQFILELINL